MQAELDVFTREPLDQVQQQLLAWLRSRIRKFPRPIWIDGERTVCLAVGIGHGHYVALCRENGKDGWRSIRHDRVDVRLSAPRKRG